ncbi:phosphoglycerate kinase [candidate division WWE3 bacterium]|uniref:Phosphoglycerate kinase n=1 Tax=candidate division WWE3 bacterium TaxID=2053526 RepID=A0A955J1T8_UNCKA|nr:phosphoglycerate kinase [candidate division WWE3 bacterium]
MPKQKRALVRCDLDVPLTQTVNEGTKIADTFRLDHALPTLELLIKNNYTPVICGHMGRPKGVPSPELSTQNLRPYFDLHLGVNNYELLENLRFDPREEQNDSVYAEQLAFSTNAHIYVNESFATSHRAHASMDAITKYLPSYAGLQLVKEVETLLFVIKNPARPLVSVIGGAKLESKGPAVSKFLEVSDTVLLGGRLGLEIEAKREDIISNLVIPTDYARAQKDIGPETTQTYSKILSQAKTVIWAGPLGVFEEDEFLKSTAQLAKLVTSNKNCYSLVGGGDSIAAMSKVGVLDKFSFVSTGGGAMLEFLIDESLPALESLEYTPTNGFPNTLVKLLE